MTFPPVEKLMSTEMTQAEEVMGRAGGGDRRTSGDGIEARQVRWREVECTGVGKATIG